MAASADWSLGYARQAQADFNMYQTLETISAVRTCHKLQFLQMACEKLVKAHLCQGGENPANLLTSHAFVRSHLPTVLRAEVGCYSYSVPISREILKIARHLAEEIDVLAPPVKRGGKRPDNCEYPWEDGAGKLHVPLDWAFYPAQLVLLPAG